MRERERVESLDYELHVLNSLMSLLCDHFEAKRFKEMSADWYSLQYKFQEYTDLSYTILKKLQDLESKTTELVKDLCKTKEGE